MEQGYPKRRKKTGTQAAEFAEEQELALTDGFEMTAEEAKLAEELARELEWLKLDEELDPRPGLSTMSKAAEKYGFEGKIEYVDYLEDELDGGGADHDYDGDADLFALGQKEVIRTNAKGSITEPTTTGKGLVPFEAKWLDPREVDEMLHESASTGWQSKGETFMQRKRPMPGQQTKVFHTPLTAKLLCMYCLEKANVSSEWLRLSAYFLTRNALPSKIETVIFRDIHKPLDAFGFFQRLYTHHIEHDIRQESNGNLDLQTTKENLLLIEIGFAVVIPCLFMIEKENASDSKQLKNVRDRLSRWFGRKETHDGALLQGRIDQSKKAGDERYRKTIHQRLLAIAIADCEKLVRERNIMPYTIILDVCTILQGVDKTNSVRHIQNLVVETLELAHDYEKSRAWQVLALKNICNADIMFLSQSISEYKTHEYLLSYMMRKYQAFKPEELAKLPTSSTYFKYVLIDIVQEMHIVLALNVGKERYEPPAQKKPRNVKAVEAVADKQHTDLVADDRPLDRIMLRLRIT